MAGRDFGDFESPHDDAVICIDEGHIKIEQWEQEATLDEVRERLDGGYAEKVPVPHLDGVQMFADEDGIAKSLDRNAVASKIAKLPLYGPVVILIGKARWI